MNSCEKKQITCQWSEEDKCYVARADSGTVKFATHGDSETEALKELVAALCCLVHLLIEKSEK